MQRGTASAPDDVQPDAPHVTIIQAFDSPGDHDLVGVGLALETFEGVGLPAISHLRLVDLDDLVDAAYRLPIRVDHGTPQLVEKQPGGLVGADPELTLQLERGDPVE